LVGVVLLGGDGNSSAGSPPRPAGPVRFTTATAYDPLGDGHEHDSEAPNAVDGDPSTYWTTETYRSFDKAGVGIVVTARRAVSPRTLTVDTDTSGFTAVIKAGDSPTSFHPVSSSRMVTGQTAFHLTDGGRYFLVWITDLGGNSHVHVNEVTAR
jgi:hypothetical protein